MALYNKYRPTNFDMVCGQPHVKRVLSSQVKKNDLVHAYLFHGGSGTGKTTVARIFAAMINASDGMTATPDIADPFVEKIMSGKGITDVFEMDAASSRGIDDVKDIREKAYHVPMEMRKRVYIIDECHMFTKEAWNALLKLLEEPPEHAIFILCTTDDNKVIDAVKTRCMRLSFRSLSVDEIAGYLKVVSSKEGISATEGALRQIALAAEGSVREAIGALEQIKHGGDDSITEAVVAKQLGIAPRKAAASFVRAVVSGAFLDGLKVGSEVLCSGVKIDSFFSKIADIMHDIMVCRAKGYDMSSRGLSDVEVGDLHQTEESIAAACGPNWRPLVRKWLTTLQEYASMTVYNMQPQFHLDALFVALKLDLQAAKNYAEKTKGG